jgi:hypothetical protein
MKIGLRISAGIASCVASLALIGPLAPVASASQAYILNYTYSDELTISGDPGERNQITVGYDATPPSPHFVLEENALGTSNATLRATGYGGAPAQCEQRSAVEVWCPPERIDYIIVSTNDEDDYVSLDRSLAQSPMTDVDPYAGSQITGGRGRDRLFGSPLTDGRLAGGYARDVVSGRGGRDSIYGDGGVDVLRGGGGPDLLFADDHRADKLIDCGPGPDDGVWFDVGLDPAPTRC